MAATTENGLSDDYIFQQLDEYSWDEDQEFQGGLRAILGSVNDPAQIQHLTLRARCYYYARKAGTTVDFDGYKRWVESKGASVKDAATTEPQETRPTRARSNTVQDAPKPATFAEICDMIAEGKPIPGIKDIPDTILEGQASESQTATRKKPWEKPAGSNDTPSWMT